MEEERVVGSSVLDQPVHGTKNVLLCGLTHGILLIVGQDDHVFSFITKMFHQISSHVSDIVDTSAQLATLAEVVYTNKQSFSAAGTVGVSKCIVVRRAVAEALRASWRNLGTVGATLVIAVRRRTWGRHAFFTTSARGSRSGVIAHRTRACIIIGLRCRMAVVAVLLLWRRWLL